MKKGAYFSAFLHITLFLILLIGLPSLTHKPLIIEPIIPIEIVQVSKNTSLASQSQPKKTPQKKRIKKSAPRKNASHFKISKKALTKPTPPKKKNSQKNITKKPQKKEDKQTKTEENDSFDSVLKTVEKFTPETHNATNSSSKKNLATPTTQTQLSISEIDAIRQQLYHCWDILGGAKNAKNLSVRILIQLQLDGTVRKATIVDQSRYNNPTEGFYRALADSALRAVWKCNPLKHLPPTKYAEWQEIEFNFDPQAMIY